ncbi:glutamate carboxypeptidase II [Sarracenia purpurea var. burkii]
MARKIAQSGARKTRVAADHGDVPRQACRTRHSGRYPRDGMGEEALPPYNAFSRDGDVTGDVVYVNYGMPDDYEALARRGIDVKGKIVLARYGVGWRGLKPKVAAEKGAIGCIIYSDPKDDGFFQGDVYPQGGYRNQNSVQRGSVADMPTYPGDVLTPTSARPQPPSAWRSRKRRRSPRSPRFHLLRRRPALLKDMLGPSPRRIGEAGFRSPITSAPQAAGPPQSGIRNGAWSNVATSTRSCPVPTSPISGCSAATITTPGSAARTTRSAAKSPCWRRPKRSARWSNPAGSLAAPSSTASGMEKSPAFSDPPNGSRLTPTNSPKRPSPTSIPTQPTRISRRRRLPLAGAVRKRGDA